MVAGADHDRVVGAEPVYRFDRLGDWSVYLRVFLTVRQICSQEF